MVGGGHGFSPIINGTPAGMDVDYEFNGESRGIGNISVTM
jgi:hypothetical protein